MGGGKSGRVAIGLVILVLGVLFLVDNYSPWDFPMATLWPIFLIVMGLAGLFRRSGPRWMGGVLVVLGAAFLLDALDVWSFRIWSLWRLWPVILVAVGLRVIFGRRKARAHRSSVTSAPDGVNVNSLFGNSEQRIAGPFSDGRVTAVFGQAVMDMSGAVLPGGEATIDAVSIFGSIMLRVPPDWVLDLRTTNILGSAQDERSGLPVDSTNRLVVTGLTMFGAIEIKS